MGYTVREKLFTIQHGAFQQFAKCALFLTHLRQFEKLGCWRFGGRENEAKSFEGCPKHPDDMMRIAKRAMIDVFG